MTSPIAKTKVATNDDSSTSPAENPKTGVPLFGVMPHHPPMVMAVDPKKMSVANLRKLAISNAGDSVMHAKVWDFVEDVVLNKSKKLVIFDEDVYVLSSVHRYLYTVGVETVVLFETRDVTERMANIEKFNDPNGVNVILCTWASAMTSLDLKVAHHLIFLDDNIPDMIFKRCLGSIHRIGQEDVQQVYQLKVTKTTAVQT